MPKNRLATQGAAQDQEPVPHRFRQAIAPTPLDNSPLTSL